MIWVYFLYSCNTVYRKGVGRHKGQRNMSSWKMANCIGLFLQLGRNGKSLEGNDSDTVELIQPFYYWFPGGQELALCCQSPHQAFFQISHDRGKLRYHDK